MLKATRNGKPNGEPVCEVIQHRHGIAARELAPSVDWREMPESEHFVQFYETDEFLLDAMSGYVGMGLCTNDACIVVATKAHLEGLEERLRAKGLDVAAARAEGQIVLLDAADTLAKLMVDASVDAGRFAEIIGGMVRRAAECHGRVRIFGEMVALLWAAGNYEAVIRLEELWNQLHRTCSFALFCAYPMDGFGGTSFAKLFDEICIGHGRVIPAESYAALSDPEVRLRTIIQLQQRAKSLEAEAAERKRGREASTHLASIVESSDDAIISKSLEGIIQSWNKGAERIFGYTAEEVIGKPIYILIPPDRVDEEPKILERLRRGERIDHYETIRMTKDGRLVDISLTISPIRDEAGTVIGVSKIARDITERRLADDRLRAVKSELEVQVADLRRLHEMSVGLTSTLDIDSVLEEVLRAAMAVQGTDRGLLLLGDPERECLAVKVHSGFDEEFLRQVERELAGDGACGACYAQRRRVVVEDVEVDAGFAPYREAALRAGFRACHSTPLITHGGNIIGVLSVHFRQPHRPSERETRLMDLYARMAADIIENARLHHRMQQELEERKQLLAREQMARAEAEEANRMKDEFLATVSHELRTPLNAIIGWTHMLRRSGLDGALMDRAIETIERNARSQAQLIEDILDVSRVITGKLRLNIGPVDLAAVVNAAIDSVQLAADSKGLQLEVTLDPSARHLSGDAGRMQQVIWNLLANAIKFTPAGGHIDVRLERVGANARISVRDTGEGISRDFLPYIFDRFRQADGTSTRRHGGLGLGLAIVRHLVELHGGTVEAESPGEGCGTSFILQLPLAAAHRGTKSQSPRPPSYCLDETGNGQAKPLPSLEGVQVLLVDDDPDTLQMLAAFMAECRADVQTAARVEEALEVLQWYRPDVLVSDLAMPGEDGYSLISKVRALEAATGRSTPAVALTAYVRVEDRARALSSGFNLFVAKPVEPSELIAAIANLTESGDGKLRRT